MSVPNTQRPFCPESYNGQHYKTTKYGQGARMCDLCGITLYHYWDKDLEGYVWLEPFQNGDKPTEKDANNELS